MKLPVAALAPLVLAACVQPSTLPEPQTLGLGAVSASAPAGHAASPVYFPDYKPRVISRGGDWRQLNRDQAPEGALE